VAVQLQENIKLPVPLGRMLLRHLTHRFHGNARATELKVPPAPLAAPVANAATLIIRARRRRLRRDAAAWKKMTDRNLSQLREELSNLAENAQYETL